MIRPVAFVATACVLALAFLVAAAAEGRLGGATGPYFPAALHQATISCPGGRARPALSAFEDGLYSKVLRAADEPPLAPASRPRDAPRVWRFTWVRTFRAPIVVRLEAAPGGVLRLVAKHLSGEGGYGPGRVDRSLDRPLTRSEAAAFQTALRTTAAFDTPATDCRRGADGSQWLLESSGPDGYHLVHRWSPAVGPVHDLGLAFLRLTGWDSAPMV